MSIPKAAKVFISYAHADRQRWMEPIYQHLRSVQNLGTIDVFDDSKIGAGDEWDCTIKDKLDEADIVVLIVTPAFLASAYCTSIEVQKAT